MAHLLKLRLGVSDDPTAFRPSLNDCLEAMLQQADLLAERLRTEAGATPETQVVRAFTLCYSRPPDDWERSESAAMIREHGLVAFCRALYNTSEFLFVF